MHYSNSLVVSSSMIMVLLLKLLLLTPWTTVIWTTGVTTTSAFTPSSTSTTLTTIIIEGTRLQRLRSTSSSITSRSSPNSLFSVNSDGKHNCIDNDTEDQIISTSITPTLGRRDLFGLVASSTSLLLPSILGSSFGLGIGTIRPAYAEVFFDPAMYGDQELRVGAVDSVKESVRRAILQSPQLAPSFYQLALLDGLSYNAATKQYGPDGSIVKYILSIKNVDGNDTYLQNLRSASLALIETEQRLRKKVQISLADAIAIGGAESIESVGGPYLTVQLGRPDPPREVTSPTSPIPIDLFSGKRSNDDVRSVFINAGLTEREATALLSGLFTLERVEKTRTSDDWKMSSKPKFREAGKMGRMSEFRPITDEDIAQAELEEELDYVPDDGWYIADSFGTREDRFGQRLAKDDINEKNFNKYLKELMVATSSSNKKNKNKNNDDDGTSPDSLRANYWTANLLLDTNYPTTATWLNKYAGANLNFLKDLNIAYNSVTQLGAVYTGGKYENLLKNKPRKSLNDDDLKLF